MHRSYGYTILEATFSFDGVLVSVKPASGLQQVPAL